MIQKNAYNCKLCITLWSTSAQATWKLNHGFLIIPLLISTVSSCWRWSSVMWSWWKLKDINPTVILLEYLGFPCHKLIVSSVNMNWLLPHASESSFSVCVTRKTESLACAAIPKTTGWFQLLIQAKGKMPSHWNVFFRKSYFKILLAHFGFLSFLIF